MRNTYHSLRSNSQIRITIKENNMHLVISQEELQLFVTTFLNLPAETTVAIQQLNTEMPVIAVNADKEQSVVEPVQMLVDPMHDAPVKSANKQSRSRSKKPANSARNSTNNNSDVLPTSQNLNKKSENSMDKDLDIGIEVIEIKPKEKPTSEIMDEVTSSDVANMIKSASSGSASSFGSKLKARFEERESTEEKKPDEPVQEPVKKSKSIFDSLDTDAENKSEESVRKSVTTQIGAGIFSHEIEERESDSVKPTPMKSLFN